MPLPPSLVPSIMAAPIISNGAGERLEFCAFHLLLPIGA